jgi:hypothetical protein
MAVTSVYDCWADSRGNKWSKQMYTKEEAEQASASLIDCSHCFNCTECTDCSVCQDCHKCISCTNCVSCKDVWKSKGCKDCEGIMIGLNVSNVKL